MISLTSLVFRVINLMSQKFYDSIKYLKSKCSADKDCLDRIDTMIDFRDNCGGEVIGYHGTSGLRGCSIADKGFVNTRCIEGGYGVYFWNGENKKNAWTFAVDKASQENDDKIAIIKARIWYPEPDWLEARPQWIVDAKCIFIEEISYFDNTETIDYNTL